MRTLRLRKEVLAQLTDEQLVAINAGQQQSSPCPTPPVTGLRCIAISTGLICDVTTTIG
jgi:hypothetical protein